MWNIVIQREHHSYVGKSMKGEFFRIWRLILVHPVSAKFSPDTSGIYAEADGFLTLCGTIEDINDNRARDPV